MGTEPMYSNAFALSGRTLSLYIHPGRCPGLCACWAFSPLLERLLSIGGQPFTRQAHSKARPHPGNERSRPAPKVYRRSRRAPKVNRRSRYAPKGKRAFKACPEGATGGRGGLRLPWHSGFPGPFSQKNCFFRKKKRLKVCLVKRKSYFCTRIRDVAQSG